MAANYFKVGASTFVFDDEVYASAQSAFADAQQHRDRESPGAPIAVFQRRAFGRIRGVKGVGESSGAELTAVPRRNGIKQYTHLIGVPR